MVDVIIPVFNAFEDLERCLASVERHRDGASFRLILVNDASTDERIAPLPHGFMAANITADPAFEYRCTAQIRRRRR